MSDALTDGARSAREAQEKRELFFRLFQCFISKLPEEHKKEGSQMLEKSFFRKNQGEEFSEEELRGVEKLLSPQKDLSNKREWVLFISKLYAWDFCSREGMMSFIRKLWPFDKDSLILGIGGISGYDTSFYPSHTFYALGQRELIQSLGCYIEIDISDFEVFKTENSSRKNSDDIYFIAIFFNNKLTYYFG